MTTFESLMAQSLSKMGLKETAVATKVFTYGDVKMLDKNSSVKLSEKEQEALKKLIEVGSFKVVDGQWGSRCKMSYVLGDRKFSDFCNIYHEDYDRDFPEGDVSEEDKKKLVVVFYEKPNDFRFTVYMMDEEVTSIDDVISKLGLD
jgi:hypothetical protein